MTYLQSIPNLGLALLNHLSWQTLMLSATPSATSFFITKGLEQLQCHLLGQAALIHFQFRTYNDNGTSGVVNTLAQQVLTETSLLALEHVGQGLQWTVVRRR